LADGDLLGELRQPRLELFAHRVPFVVRHPWRTKISISPRPPSWFSRAFPTIVPERYTCCPPRSTGAARMAWPRTEEDVSRSPRRMGPFSSTTWHGTRPESATGARVSYSGRSGSE